MDSGESMAQMAQFTMTEQMTNMASTNAKIAAALNTSSAVGLIGRTVNYIDADGATQTGKVERVATSKERRLLPLPVRPESTLRPSRSLRLTGRASPRRPRSTHLS